MLLCPKCDKDKNHSKQIIERFVLLFIPNLDFSFLLHIKHWFLNFSSTLSSVITVRDGGCRVILGTGNVVSAWIAHRECQNDITLPSAALWHLGSAGVCMFAWVSRGGWNWMTITSVDESSEGQKVSERHNLVTSPLIRPLLLCPWCDYEAQTFQTCTDWFAGLV